MQTLYFDCFAGASGNMILGALIAAGVDASHLKASLKTIDLPDFEINVESVQRAGISSTHVSVEIPDQKKHRHLPEIEKIIDDSALSDGVKERSLKIFRRLAEAEAKVHGIEVEKVHFHEVGSLDAVIDVVGACVGFEMLGIERFACSKIHVGSGFVNIAHGKYSIPPPAVAELLTGFPVYSTEIEGELITPTGAAIISTLCTHHGGLPEIAVEITGYGAGTRTYDGFPNVLRLMIGEAKVAVTPNQSAAAVDDTLSERLALLETNIDDLSPQVLGYVLERAFEIGALDAWFTPIQMKKNRPAVTVSILCANEVRSRIEEMLYLETTTLGIRSVEIERNSLPREEIEVETRFGKVSIKTASLRGKVVNAMPEYEHIRRIATETGISFREVQNEVMECFRLVGESGRVKAKSV